MARRRPAQVRAATHRHLAQPVPELPGLSPRGRAAIAHLERTRLWPGAAREALDAWTRFLRDPYHRLFDPASGCGALACCPDPIDYAASCTSSAIPCHDTTPANSAAISLN